MAGIEARLIQGGWVTQEQLKTAQLEAERANKNIWSSLVKLGYLSEEDVFIFFAQESNLCYVKVADYALEGSVLKILDEPFCREHVVIPLYKVKTTLFVACANPQDTDTIDSIARTTGLTVEPLCASHHSVQQALDTYFGPKDSVFMFEQFLFKPAPLQGITFHREAERTPLNIPVTVKVLDKDVILRYSAPIEGFTRNISISGTAIGLQVFLYLPKGLEVLLEFKTEYTLFKAEKTLTARGTIVYCGMEKGLRYALGIAFTQIDNDVLNKLLQISETKK